MGGDGHSGASGEGGGEQAMRRARSCGHVNPTLCRLQSSEHQ